MRLTLNPKWRPSLKPSAAPPLTAPSSRRTARALILPPLLAALALTACGDWRRAGGAQIPGPDASVSAPCRHPSEYLDAGDWEIIAGRIGDELILCGQKHAAQGAYLEDIIGAQ